MTNKKLILPLLFLFLALQFSLYSQETLTEKGGFGLDANEEHYFLFVLNNRPSDLPEVRVEITKYIWKHHPDSRLKITQIKIDGELEEVPMIHVKSFSNKAEAMKFYHDLKKNRPEFLQMGMTVDYFALSKSNFDKIVLHKSLKGYKPFFQTHYQ